MKESFTTKQDYYENLINTDSNTDNRNTFYFSQENNIFNNNLKADSKTDFVIKSITPEISTINKVLGYSTDYNDDIFIFEIKGDISGNANTSIFSQISWKIYKNIKQIKELFEQIRKELSKNDIIDNKITAYCKIVKGYTNGEIYNNINNIAKNIKDFYNSPNGRNLTSLKEGLRISATSFSNNTEIKQFEGYAYKKAQPRVMRTIFKFICYPLEHWFFKGWNKRWIVLKEDMISYLNSPTTLVGKNVYWFDVDIDITASKDKFLEIKSLSKSLILKFDSRFERDLWKKEIDERIEKINEEITTNVYNSFASQKMNCGAKWFVDGDSYFSYLLNQLKNAKESVFITDWFMSPELALRRPINYNDFIDEKNDYKKNLNFDNVSRLMDIFYLLAKKGVKIYILLYCEVTLALSINSLYTKTVLKNLHHQNILITRHPKGNKSLLWSHHEKLVIIDQKIAFVGGLDLCWGRYDTNAHPIVEEENESQTYYYPGSDYINERQVDLHNVEQFYKEQLDRNSMPRMAWHDVHTMVEGPIVSDIVRHFVERWNDARFSRRNKGLVNVGKSFSSKESIEIDTNKNKNKKKKKKNIEIELNSAKDDNKFFKKQSKTLKTDKIILTNKINYNIDNIKEEENDDDDDDENDDLYIIKTNDINEKKSPNKDFPNSYRSNNLMNQDDEFPLFNSDSDEFNAYKSKDAEDKNRFSRMFTNIKNKVKDVKDIYEDYKNNHINKKKKMSIRQKAFLKEDGQQKDQTISMDFNIQALRSVCEWSIGKSKTERSILKGYYKLIDEAKHYIYIENQFFITKSFSEDERNINSKLNLNKIVQNEIGLHIRARIERAYEEKSNFKVFICIPLLPGFSGTPGESSTMNGVLKHTYQSIAHNKGMSLLEQLKEKLGNDLNNYIYFYSLRNHGEIKGMPVTELIYIHSKLLIIDDEKVLIGSANINDRSMKGSRDSEFAVIIDEQKKIESIMDGKKYLASNYAKSLRKQLMSEHMGLSLDDPILDDPLNDELWTKMKSTAKVNSVIYSDIFDCFPDNKFKTFADLKKRKIIKTEEDKEKLKKDYHEKIFGIQGHIVEYPIEFLKDEELDIDFFSKENLVPEKNFT